MRMRIPICGTVIFMRERGSFSTALCAVAAAMGADFATGRALSAFYAQMGRASWLGAAVSAAVFGGLMAMLAHLARRAGAVSVPALLRRMPGGRMGAGAAVVYGLLVAAGVCAMMASAGHAGALMLPMRRAGLFAGALAACAAATLCLAGARAMRRVCGGFVGCMALYELALALFGNPQGGAALNFELELKLRDNVPAAILLALVHACVCACMAAGMPVRFSGGRARPARIGLWSGGLFLLMLLGGNAALMRAPEEWMALRVPFVALSAGWGGAGFYLSAILAWFASVMSLAGLNCALFPRKMMLNYEDSPTFD